MSKSFLTGILAPFVKIEDDPLLPNDAVNKKYVDRRTRGLFLRKIVDEIDKNLYYVGEAEPGTATSASTWAIKKIEFINGDVFVTWANSVNTLTNVWDDRLTYTYG